MVCGGVGELGNRAVRVPASGTGEPHRVHRVLARAAEDSPGGNHAGGLRAVRGAVHAATAPPRLPVGGTLYLRSGVLHFSRPAGRVSYASSGSCGSSREGRGRGFARACVSSSTWLMVGLTFRSAS